MPNHHVKSTLHCGYKLSRASMMKLNDKQLDTNPPNQALVHLMLKIVGLFVIESIEHIIGEYLQPCFNALRYEHNFDPLADVSHWYDGYNYPIRFNIVDDYAKQHHGNYFTIIFTERDVLHISIGSIKIIEIIYITIIFRQKQNIHQPMYDSLRCSIFNNIDKIKTIDSYDQFNDHLCDLKDCFSWLNMDDDVQYRKKLWQIWQIELKHAVLSFMKNKTKN